jgi:hypothetical protein
MCIGARWKANHGVPYVLDLQDPWYRPKRGYFTSRHVLKARITNALYKRMERSAVIGAAGLVAVSPRYLDEMNSRYVNDAGDWCQPLHQAAIPFAASDRDLDTVRRTETTSTERQDGEHFNLVYVGAGGNTRAASFEAVCAGMKLALSLNCELVERVRVGLYGTTGGTSPGTVLHDIAKQYGVGHLVEERPEQVSYFQSIRLAADADGLLILGVDDRGYTPSKLFSYLLFGKPVLASFQVGSPAESFVLQKPDTASLIRFGGDDATVPEVAARILIEFLQQVSEGRREDRTSVIEQYLAPAMAKRHAELFDRIVDGQVLSTIENHQEAPVA